MELQNLPAHVARVLEKLDDVRPTKDGWDARCPCLDHGSAGDHPGDQHPSLRITVGDDGRVLLKCRVGCKTDAVLQAARLAWNDLFPPADEVLSPVNFASNDHGGATDPDLIHEVYQRLLNELKLSDDHHAQLVRRGLTPEAIRQGDYRSLKNIDRGRAAKAVHGQLGGAVLGVPGFMVGDYGVTLAGTATGLLIPVRDLSQRIQALKIRREGEPKYLYLAGGEDGLSGGSPVHVPLGITAPAETVRVTEGELKADVCMLLDGTPTIGIPGVTQWRAVFPLLHELRAKTVIIAFDAIDLYDKTPVFVQAEAFWRELKDQGYDVQIEDWYDA